VNIRSALGTAVLAAGAAAIALAAATATAANDGASFVHVRTAFVVDAKSKSVNSDLASN
jgi:hypothetical protein